MIAEKYRLALVQVEFITHYLRETSGYLAFGLKITLTCICFGVSIIESFMKGCMFI